MRVGIPKEVKAGENRVALTPAGAAELYRRGHSIFVMRSAGRAAGFSDESYQQSGAHHLEMAQGGKGILLGGIPGVSPANVLILSGGVVGANAAAMAVGMGAQVRIPDKSIVRLRQLDDQWRGRVVCEYATQERIDALAIQADLIIGSVLNAGASAPRLLSRELIGQMEKGSVLVDFAIDQGGCFATSRPTTHQQPTFIEEGVVHYCVANIPSAVGRTATLGLTNATLDYIIRLADEGLAALRADSGFRAGLNIYRGQLTQRGVADSFATQNYCFPRISFPRVNKTIDSGDNDNMFYTQARTRICPLKGVHYSPLVTRYNSPETLGQ